MFTPSSYPHLCKYLVLLLCEEYGDIDDGDDVVGVVEDSDGAVEIWHHGTAWKEEMRKEKGGKKREERR